MATWDDLLLRLNLDDHGVYPNRAGVPCASPDIIPWGTQPAIDWQTRFGQSSYGTDVGTNPVVDQDNYIYGRSKNLRGGPQFGKFYCYWSKASAITWPKQWSGNAMRTNTGADHVDFSAAKTGDVAVCSEPLKWNPRKIDGNDHYCLIGRVTTNEHPNPIPNVTIMPDFAQYIRDNPNMCWRNVALVSEAQPTTIFDIGYDQGDEAGMMVVQVSGTHLPVAPPGKPKAAVAFDCSTAGPQPLMVLNPTEITTASMSIGIKTVVPAKFTAPVRIKFWSNGLPIDPAFDLEFEYFFAPSFTLRHHLALHEHGYTMTAERAGFSRQLIHDLTEDMRHRGMLHGNTPPHVVRVGSYGLRKAKLMHK
jgi:hypothetical protein